MPTPPNSKQIEERLTSLLDSGVLSASDLPMIQRIVGKLDKAGALSPGAKQKFQIWGLQQDPTPLLKSLANSPLGLAGGKDIDKYKDPALVALQQQSFQQNQQKAQAAKARQQAADSRGFLDQVGDFFNRGTSGIRAFGTREAANLAAMGEDDPIERARVRAELSTPEMQERFKKSATAIRTNNGQPLSIGGGIGQTVSDTILPTLGALGLAAFAPPIAASGGTAAYLGTLGLNFGLPMLGSTLAAKGQQAYDEGAYDPAAMGRHYQDIEAFGKAHPYEQFAARQLPQLLFNKFQPGSAAGAIYNSARRIAAPKATAAVLRSGGKEAQALRQSLAAGGMHAAGGGMGLAGALQSGETNPTLLALEALFGSAYGAPTKAGHLLDSVIRPFPEAVYGAVGNRMKKAPHVASMRPQGQEITPPSHQLPPGPTDGQIMGDGFVMRPARANPTHVHADGAAPSTPPPVSPGGMFPDFPSGMKLRMGQYAPRAEATPPMPTTSVDRPRRTYAAPIDPAEAIPAQTPVEGRAPISTEEALRFAAGPTLGKRPVVVKPPARKWRPYKPGPRRIGTTENPNVREEASPVVEAPSTPKPMPAPVEVKSPAETPVAPPAAKPDTSSPPPRSKEDAQQSVDDLRDFIESDTQGTAKPKTDASFSVQDAANVHEDLTAVGRQVVELKDGNWIGYVGEIEKNGKKYTVIAQGTHGKGGLTFHYSEVPSKAATTPESATSKKKVVETPKAETPQSDTSNVRNTDHAAADRLESRMADADVEAVNSGKPYVKKLAAQLFKEGVLDKSTLDEVNRVASDRDMDGGDVLDVFKSDVYDHIDRLRGKDGLKPPPTDAQIEAQMKEREAFNRRTDERLSEGSNVRESAATDDAAEKLKQRKAQQALDEDIAAQKRVSGAIAQIRERIKTLASLIPDHQKKLNEGASLQRTIDELEGRTETLSDKQKLREAKEFLSKGKRDREAASQEIENLKTEIESLKETLSQATKERSRLSSRINRQGGAGEPAEQPAGMTPEELRREIRKDDKEILSDVLSQIHGAPTVTKTEQATYHERPLSRLMPGRKIDGDGGWSVFHVEPAAKADSGTKMLAHGGDRLTGGNKPPEYVPYRENSVNVRIRRPGQRDFVVFGAGVDANGDIVLHDGSKLIVEKPQTAESIAKKNKQIAEGGPNKGC